MDHHDWLAERFEETRPHLRRVAYRMLGSSTEADDAVQEAWLRLSRAGASGVENLGGWLTTVVARVCLDMLRSRRSRREDPLEAPPGAEAVAAVEAGADPEHEALMGDSVGLAMLVVLRWLPASWPAGLAAGSEVPARPERSIAPGTARSSRPSWRPPAKAIST